MSRYGFGLLEGRQMAAFVQHRKIGARQFAPHVDVQVERTDGIFCAAKDQRGAVDRGQGFATVAAGLQRG